MALIFEISQKGRKGSFVPPVEKKYSLSEKFRRREKANLPEVSELDVVRHYTHLSQKNFSIDTHFYPLGSCTMKYNPRFHEIVAGDPNFRNLHPLQDASQLQGILAILWEVEEYLKELTGMDGLTFQPSAGAHGELTSLLMIHKYFKDHNEVRPHVLIPDSAHGTNPASAALVGFRTIKVKTDSEGLLDMEDFQSKVDEKTAALMITNPNTLGLFEKNIQKMADILHNKGAFLYMDGANFNAIIGVARPGDFGVDLMHLNLHKTFSTPHGGGGPGSGPVAVKEKLLPYLPAPVIRKEGDTYQFAKPKKTIGKVRSFYGNIGVILRAYCYLRSHGPEDFRDIAYYSVLNANYLAALVKDFMEIPYGERCMHEFVGTGKELKKYGVRTLDVAKRLLDYGFHAPTIYFPLVVPEALMIEPTETESKQTLDRFAEALRKIWEEAKENPEVLKEAPHNLPVRRLDEVRAARQPVLCCASAGWEDGSGS
ncbi:MAG: glycine dehydrogenase subunit 2 [Planctomycetota bacterium]|nr:MAG: glycine dehydrogenase subunit 2 [Planctomycetota bacterium]